MKKEVAKELRKNAEIIASAHYGKVSRNAMSNSLEALASFIEAEEIPVRKLVAMGYLKGCIWGLVIAALIMGIVTAIERGI